MTFEQAFQVFLEEQKRGATGRRLERLNKDLVGEKKLLEAVVWPVLKSFEGIILEHEIILSNGLRIYIDVFIIRLLLALESEGFASHAEMITRDRFSFEKKRIRAMKRYRMRYVPFSKDELDKTPLECQRDLYEIIGTLSGTASRAYELLTVYEREVIRFGLGLHRPFRLADVQYCLGAKYRHSRNVVRSLLNKKMIDPIGTGTQRFHEFVLLPSALELML